MDKKLLRKLEKYDWENFLNEDEKSAAYTKKEFFAACLENFAYEFSPVCGFLGLSYKKRDKKDSIEFIIASGLVKNKKEAKKLINLLKDKPIHIDADNHFTLTEYITPNLEKSYKAKFKRTYG